MSTALLVVDTETGGLDPAQACIVELAALVVVVDEDSLDVGERFYARIKPDRPVAPQAAAVNGYTPDAWRDAEEPAAAFARFRQWVEEQCKTHKRPMWCGCNPLFDLKFYNSDRKRAGESAPEGLSYRVIDVQSMAFPLLFRGEVRGLSLAKLRAWAGMPDEQKHTALDDVLDTAEVIGALLLKGLQP